jgi:hypothetical protein
MGLVFEQTQRAVKRHVGRNDALNAHSVELLKFV